MTIVVQTSIDTDQSVLKAIREVSTKHMLHAQDHPVAFDDTRFQYFDTENNEVIENAINDFLQIDGVSTAYAKPGGMPPAP